MVFLFFKEKNLPQGTYTPQGGTEKSPGFLPVYRGYLTWKAESVGYTPQVILSGRRINDNMGKFIAEKTVKMMLNGGVEIKGTKVGILGLTFKENCPDLRNSRVVDIINELKSYGIQAIVHDPLVTQQQALKYAGVELAKLPNLQLIILLIP